MKTTKTLMIVLNRKLLETVLSSLELESSDMGEIRCLYTPLTRKNERKNELSVSDRKRIESLRRIIKKDKILTKILTEEIIEKIVKDEIGEIIICYKDVAGYANATIIKELLAEKFKGIIHIEPDPVGKIISFRSVHMRF